MQHSSPCHPGVAVPASLPGLTLATPSYSPIVPHSPTSQPGRRMGAVHSAGPDSALVISGGLRRRGRTLVVGGWGWAWLGLSTVHRNTRPAAAAGLVNS